MKQIVGTVKGNYNYVNGVDVNSVVTDTEWLKSYDRLRKSILFREDINTLLKENIFYKMWKQGKIDRPLYKGLQLVMSYNLVKNDLVRSYTKSFLYNSLKRQFLHWYEKSNVVLSDKVLEYLDSIIQRKTVWC